MAGAGGSSRWTDALLDRMRELGDPVADIPVAAVLERDGVDAVRAIMRSLVRVDQPVPEELPDELKAYLLETLPLPEWADADRIKRGQQPITSPATGTCWREALGCWAFHLSTATGKNKKDE